MLIPVDLGRRPEPRVRKRMYLAVGVIATAVVALLIMQYTSYRLLPAGKTDGLWGMLVGMGLMGGAAELHWRKVDRED